MKNEKTYGELSVENKLLKKENKYLKEENKFLRKTIKAQNTMCKMVVSTRNNGNAEEADELAKSILSIFGGIEDMLSFKMAYDNYLFNTEAPLDIIQFIADGTLVQTQLLGCFGEYVSNFGFSFAEKLMDCINKHGETAVNIFFENLDEFLKKEMLPMLECMDNDSFKEYCENGKISNSDNTDTVSEIAQFIESSDELQQSIVDELMEEQDEVSEPSPGMDLDDYIDIEVEEEVKSSEYVEDDEQSGKLPISKVITTYAGKRDYNNTSNEEVVQNSIYNEDGIIILRNAYEKYKEIMDILNDISIYNTPFDKFDIVNVLNGGTSNISNCIRTYKDAYNKWCETAIEICKSIPREYLGQPRKYITRFNNSYNVYCKEYPELELPIVDYTIMESFCQSWITSYANHHFTMQDMTVMYFYEKVKDPYDPLMCMMNTLTTSYTSMYKKSRKSMINDFTDLIKVKSPDYKSACMKISEFLVKTCLCVSDEYEVSNVVAGVHGEPIGSFIISSVLEGRTCFEIIDCMQNISQKDYQTSDSYIITDNDLDMLIDNVIMYDEYLPIIIDTKNIKENIHYNLDTFIKCGIIRKKMFRSNEKPVEKFSITSLSLFMSCIYSIYHDDSSYKLCNKFRNMDTKLLSSFVISYFSNTAEKRYSDIVHSIIKDGSDVHNACMIIIDILKHRHTLSNSKSNTLFNVSINGMVDKVSTHLKVNYNIVRPIILDLCEIKYNRIIIKDDFNYSTFLDSIVNEINIRYNRIKSEKLESKSYNDSVTEELVLGNNEPKSVEWKQIVQSWGEDKQLQFLEDCESNQYDNNTELLKRYGLSIDKKRQLKSKIVRYICNDIFDGMFNPDDYRSIPGRKYSVNRDTIDKWSNKTKHTFLEDCKRMNITDLVKKYRLSSKSAKAKVVHLICDDLLVEEGLNAEDYLK